MLLQGYVLASSPGSTICLLQADTAGECVSHILHHDGYQQCPPNLTNVQALHPSIPIPSQKTSRHGQQHARASGNLSHLSDLRSASIWLRALLRSSTSPDSKDSRKLASDSLGVLLEAARTFTIASPGQDRGPGCMGGSRAGLWCRRA